MSGRILVVEDDPDISRLAQTYLEREGYEVLVAADGLSALDMVKDRDPDVIVLDVMLPGMDGLAVCREVRRERVTPILIVSARDEDVDKIVGLEVGADDYITKPFNPRELVARVRAMMRRIQMTAAPESSDGVIKRRNVKIFVEGHRVEVDGKKVALTPIEFSLLRVLAGSPGRAYSRQELLDQVWGADFIGDERTVDAHVRNLRHKLQSVNPQYEYVVAVWRVGYRFEE